MVMKPKITLKVAKAVENESASFSEASLGRSDWEWKQEEDASFVECGSSADHHSSSGNESSVISKMVLAPLFPHLFPLLPLLPGWKFSPKRKLCPARAQSGPSPLPSKVLRSVAQ